MWRSRPLLCTSLALVLAPALAHADSFGPSKLWHPTFSLSGEIPLTGDFTGDGFTDVVTFLRSMHPDSTGDVWVARSNGEAFVDSHRWHENFGWGDDVPMVGNFDGDGFDDVIIFRRNPALPSTSGDVYVARSNGTAFGTATKWHSDFCVGDQLCRVGDVNGDGKDDILAFVRNTGGWEPGYGDVWVALSNGTSFGAPSVWHHDFCFHDETPLVGDVNGDGRADIVTLVQDTDVEPHKGDVWVSLSTGTGFASSSIWKGSFCNHGTPFLGDIDGDPAARADLVCFVRSELGGDDKGDVVVSRSNGSAFVGNQVWHDYFGIGNEVPALGDFDFDGRSDLVIFKQNTSSSAIGDTLVSLNADPSQARADSALAAFGWNTMRIRGKEPRGQRKLLTILVDWSDVPAHHDASFFASFFFGAAETKTVRGYFWEVSNQLFTYWNGGIVGPYQFPDDPDTAVDESKRLCGLGANQPGQCPGTTMNDDKYLKKALTLASVNGYDFSADDLDGDGQVTSDELQIVVINAVGTTPADTYGINRSPCVSLNGKNVCVGIGGFTEYAGLATITHELSHTLGTKDVYGWNGGYNERATLMGATITGVNDDRFSVFLDAWHRMRLGWVKPRVYDLWDPGSCEELRADGLKEPVLIYDSRKGTDEFFLLELRSKSGSVYDGQVVQTGVAIWNVNQDGEHNLVRVAAPRIDAGPPAVPGGNRVLDTVPAGDDVVGGTSSWPRILAGPNGILDTTPSGDDAIATDDGLVLQSIPHGPRDVEDFASTGDGTFQLLWTSGSGTPVLVDVGPGSSSLGRSLKWTRYSMDVEPVIFPGWSANKQACYSHF